MDPIRVLLIDDNPGFLRIATRFLQEACLGEVTVVGTARGGREALAQTLDPPPEVILLDLMMPDLNGLDVIPRLRARLPHARIIALTLLDTSSYQSAALAAGADAFIPKTAMNTDLLPAIRQAMQANRERCELDNEAELARASQLARANMGEHKPVEAALPDRLATQESQERYRIGDTRDIAERKRVETAQQHHAQELMALYETSLEVNSQWDLPTLLFTIVQGAAALSGARMAALYLVQPDSGTLRLAAGHNLPSGLVGAELRLGQGLAGRIAQTGKPMTMDDDLEDQSPREAYAPSPLRRVFGVPLKMDRRVIGVLHVVDDDQTALVSPHDLWLMGLFAEQAAMAIKNARLYEAAQHELAERRRAEEALRRGERFLASILDSIQDGLSIFDQELDIVRVNPTMEQWYSYAMPLVGKKCYRAYHGRSAPCENCPAQQALATGQAAYAVVPKRSADGQVAGWLDLYAFPRLDVETGQVRGAIEYVRDITERKLVEGALYQRNRDLALLNQVSQMLTATLDLQEVTGRLARALTQTIGTEGASVWVWDSERPGGLVCLVAIHADLQRALVNVRLGPGEGIAGWVAQNRQSAIVHRVSDAEPARFCPAVDAQTGFHTLSVLAVPLCTRDQVIGVLEAVNKLEGEFDAHDLALAETLASSAAIAIENAQLVETLRRQAGELEARNQELDAFAHTVAHDLKGPLSPIIGFAAALEQDWAATSGDELRQALRDIARSAHKMDNIIDELLLLAGLRHMQVEPRRLDMACIVSESLSRLADMIQVCRAEIVLPDASAWPEALGYAPWVEEIWVNYLSNALKYGGTPAAALRVELGATAQDGGMVRFWVRDNGPGLSPEEQAQLFAPFTRLDRVRAKGHGLGLSIVRRIVEKLGGQAGVESQGAPGGSVFYFTLPGAGGIAG